MTFLPSLLNLAIQQRGQNQNQPQTLHNNNAFAGKPKVNSRQSRVVLLIKKTPSLLTRGQAIFLIFVTGYSPQSAPAAQQPGD